MPKTTLADLETLQDEWVNRLQNIGELSRVGADRDKIVEAGNRLVQLYAYEWEPGPVAFKPTMATFPTDIRTTAEGALSYFVGGNPNFPNDHGFGLTPHPTVEITNIAVVPGDPLLAMGHMDFGDVVADFTMAARTYENGETLLVAHHSSKVVMPSEHK